MNFSTYLSFNGTCEAAMDTYIKILDGTYVHTMRYNDGPPEYLSDPANGNKIMHTTIKFDGGEIKASDRLDLKSDFGNAFHLSIAYKDEAKAEEVFNALADGGKIEQEYEPVFWGGTFGSLVDKFGVQWMVSGGGM